MATQLCNKNIAQTKKRSTTNRTHTSKHTNVTLPCNTLPCNTLPCTKTNIKRKHITNHRNLVYNQTEPWINTWEASTNESITSQPSWTPNTFWPISSHSKSSSRYSRYHLNTCTHAADRSGFVVEPYACGIIVRCLERPFERWTFGLY